MSLTGPEESLVSLVQIRDAAQQRAYISDTGIVPTLAHVKALSEIIRETCPKDLPLAEVLAETNLYLASLIGTPATSGYAARSRAQVLYSMRRCADAQPYFEQAVEFFHQADLDDEAGRTMVTQLDNLMYLSRYEDALRLEAPARAALEKVQDRRYLANLENALGNHYYRLNRLPESLARYESAQASSEHPFTTAAIGMGRAHVLSDMNRFDEALEAYETTKKHCEEHGLKLWIDIADRGISKIHLGRGKYSTALRMLEQIRRKHEAANDSRRVGLCDIDRTKIYLELNLFEDASTLAKRAYKMFHESGSNRYESALCLTFGGIAEFKLMSDADAETDFLRAREIFIDEGNEIWVAEVDLWRAQLMIRQQQFSAARELARHSAEVFEKLQVVPVRVAKARVVSAQSLQELQETDSAMADAQLALRELEGLQAPWVSYQAFDTLGRLKESDGATVEAEGFYLRAIEQLESLRGNINLDELRMSFGKDKYQVYENIVKLKLNRSDVDSAFEFVERLKSRTLIDLLERTVETVWDVSGEESPRFHRIRRIREELNGLYSRLNEAGTTARAAASDTTTTKEEIGAREQELVELLREGGSEKPGWATLQSMQLPSVVDVQSMLEPDEILVEYYAIGDRFQAFIIGREDFHVVRDLCSAASTRASLKGLNFQLSKFHLQPAYLQRHADALLNATRHHLKNLYEQLIAPLAHLIKGRKRLVVVPHQMLHYVPFHALFDGERFLIDDYGVSYGASASVLRICRTRKAAHEGGRDLILAVADELTPYINDEVAALREVMPDANVFVGAEATEQTLRQYAPTAGKIHIAAHGIFRADNPNFSQLKLGDNWLNPFDIFNLQLGADITTLSACETGMSDVWGGDELLGLVRAFLYAGTPSLVVSLWMVNDRSTAQMMRRFYEGLRDGLGKSQSLRAAILEVKAAFPHPYFWAPFVLLGKSL